LNGRGTPEISTQSDFQREQIASWAGILRREIPVATSLALS